VNGVWLIPALIQGLVAGIVSLVVVAVAAAGQGRSGVTFVELLTSIAVGIAVGAVSFLTPKVIEWQVRRQLRGHEAESSTTHVVASSGSWGAAPADPASATRHQPDRFDRFTDAARRSLTLAQDEAQRFQHTSIGTEHLLLGLVRDRDTVAGAVLAAMGIDVATVRSAVEFIIGRGNQPASGEIGLTADAKRTIELAIDEARQLDHHRIGTEHLLLGLVRVPDGIAGGVLESVGVTHDRARIAVLETLERGTTER
jgi:hypothetical protein